jgi:hypothetical protein
MKLPDFRFFEPFNGLKGRMGIPTDVYGSFTLEATATRLTRDELDRLSSGEGIDIIVKR